MSDSKITPYITHFQKPSLVSIIKGVLSFGLYNIYLHNQYELHEKQFRNLKIPVYNNIEITINDK